MKGAAASRRQLQSPSQAPSQPARLGRARLARELFAGRYAPGQSLNLRDVAREYQLDQEVVLKMFAEFQFLGMVAISDGLTAVVKSPNPKEMLEAYEIRAALEEIAGRAAAAALKGDTARLQKHLDSMRAAIKRNNLDAYAEHAASFHRTIIEASNNELLLRVWNTLAFELRIRAMVSKIVKDLPDLAETHQPVIDALHQGRAKEAGLLLRSQIETFRDRLKKAESDSGTYTAIRKDLERAKDIQQAFFPPQMVSIPCLGCETFYQPAHGIGGDYYDFLPLQAGRWGIAIGDVSGKGIGAALIMASLQASLRAQSLHPDIDPSTVVRHVNRLVRQSSPADFFASLFYAEYTPSTRVLKYVNAGHNPPIVVSPRFGDLHTFRLQSTDMPVGISDEPRFPAASFQLHVGDILVAYTDGITEAENADGELWGDQRLERLLRSSSASTSAEIVDSVLLEVSAFASGQPQKDDATLVVMRVQPGCTA